MLEGRNTKKFSYSTLSAAVITGHCFLMKTKPKKLKQFNMTREEKGGKKRNGAETDLSKRELRS